MFPVGGSVDWTFENNDVASGFDRHVREQLPWYDLATEMVVHLARNYVGKGGRVYDIGASTGNIGRAMQPLVFGRSVDFVAIESSKEMCERYDGPGVLHHADAVTYPYQSFDLAIVFLTLMFIKPEYRQPLVNRLFARCAPGGAVVIVDKDGTGGGYPKTVMQRLTMAGKLWQGAEPAAVLNKEMALQGVQRPLDVRIFAQHAPIEFFRFGEFAGWVLEKPEPM